MKTRKLEPAHRPRQMDIPPMNEGTIQIRRDICAKHCPHNGCKAYRNGQIRHDDPCEACPQRAWGSWGAGCHEAEITPLPGYSEAEERAMAANVVRSISPKLGTAPGDLLKWMIWQATGIRAGNCSCDERARIMNEWGWIGCLRRREEIVGWLVDEARRRGVELAGTGARALFVAAWRAWRARR